LQSFPKPKKKTAQQIAQSAKSSGTVDYKFNYSFSRHGDQGLYILVRLNRGCPNAQQYEKFQNDQRNAMQEETLISQLNNIGVDIACPTGLDRRDGRDGERTIQKSETGRYANRVFGVPMWAVYLCGKEDADGNTTDVKWEPEHNEELLRKLDGIFKAAHAREYRKNKNVTGEPEYYPFDIDTSDVSVKVAPNKWQAIDYCLTDKAAADMLMTQYEPVTVNKEGQDKFLKSFVVTFYDTASILASLFSPHPDTGAYSGYAIKFFGFPFHEKNTEKEINDALWYLFSECDLQHADVDHLKIILNRLNVAMEKGILDLAFKRPLQKLSSASVAEHQQDAELEEAQLFHKNVTNLKRKSPPPEKGQEKITTHLIRTDTHESAAAAAAKSDSDDDDDDGDKKRAAI
jgi:hypothetical protein